MSVVILNKALNLKSILTCQWEIYGHTLSYFYINNNISPVEHTLMTVKKSEKSV